MRVMRMLLVLQGNEIKNMRGFEVFFDMLPMLKSKKRCIYKSYGYKGT